MFDFQSSQVSQGPFTTSHKNQRIFRASFSPIHNKRKLNNQKNVYYPDEVEILQPEKPISSKRALELLHQLKEQPQTSHLIKKEFLRSKTTEPDPFELQKKISLEMHPLWQESLKVWLNAIEPEVTARSDGETIQTISYDKFKDLRLCIYMSLNPEFKYEDALCDIWEEWVILTNSHKELRVLREYDFSNGSLNYKYLSKFLQEIVSRMSPHLDPISYVFIFNSIMMNSSDGESIEESKLRNWRKISKFPAAFFDIIKKLSTKNPRKVEFTQWFQQNFAHLSDMQMHVTNLLMAVFPEDNRIHDLWRKFVTPNTSAILVECIETLNNALKSNGALGAEFSPLRDQKVRLPGRLKTREGEVNEEPKKVEVLRDVKLPIIGKSCLPNKEGSIEEVSRDTSKDLQISDAIILNSDSKNQLSIIEDRSMKTLEVLKNFQKASSLISKFTNKSLESGVQSPESEKFMSPRFTPEDREFKLQLKPKDADSNPIHSQMAQSPMSTLLSKKRFSTPHLRARKEEINPRSEILASPLNRRNTAHSAKESTVKRILKSYDSKPSKLEDKSDSKDSSIILVNGKTPVMYYYDRPQSKPRASETRSDRRDKSRIANLWDRRSNDPKYNGEAIWNEFLNKMNKYVLVNKRPPTKKSDKRSMQKVMLNYAKQREEYWKNKVEASIYGENINTQSAYLEIDVAKS
ncbi:unnamed protein product [Blepharisma stoltei]|uniref:Uncharacterized protein n=1 Tax=Blepharisma stoltei TaxID=1481888 RepID=A0AAU9JAW9_9CILI|nr:unnamed protein product [Blepharisma stoltei]